MPELKVWDGTQWVGSGGSSFFLPLAGGTVMQGQVSPDKDASQDNNYTVGASANPWWGVYAERVYTNAMRRPAGQNTLVSVADANNLYDQDGNFVAQAKSSQLLAPKLVMPAAHLALAANYTLSTTGGTVIPFDDVIFDTGGLTGANNGFRIQEAGIYLVSFSPFHLSSVPDSGDYYQITRNGGNTDIAIMRRNSWAAYQAGGPTMSGLVKLELNDTIQVKSWVGLSNIVLRAGAQVGTHFTIHKVSHA